MITPSHRRLAQRINKLPMKALLNEQFLEILALLFSEEEAEILSRTPLLPAGAEKIAKRARRPVAEVRPLLDHLAAQGLIAAGGEGERKYLVLAFLPGIFEYYTVLGKDDEKKRRFAELYEAYHNREFSAYFSRKPVSIARVIPVQKSVSHQIGVLPSDLIRAAIDRHDYWSVAVCACRKQNSLIGKDCDKPKEVCMQFGNAARGAVRSGFSRAVSREEILAAVDGAEAAGLVHVTDNVSFPHLSCNCCGCCCDAMATLNRFNTPAAFVRSRFIAQQEAAKCKACGICVKSCPVGALHFYAEKMIIEPQRCIGCGVCVSRCKTGALSLSLRPDYKAVPENYGQMIVHGLTEVIGIEKQAYSLAPRLTSMLGDWIQEGMNKGLEKRKQNT